MKTARILHSALKDFYNDNGIAHASAIAYSAAMTIVPFCLLLVAIFGCVLGSNQAMLQFLIRQMTGLFPSTGGQIVEGLKLIITHKSIGNLTLCLYLLFSFQLFLSIESTTNIIFKETDKRTITKSFLLSMGVITLITTTLILSFLATSAITILHTYFPQVTLNQQLAVLIAYAMPLFLLFLIITALYKLVPTRPIPLSAIVPGAAFTSLMFELAKHAFTLYIINFPNMGLVYGSLWAFFIFLTWLYYSSCVYLIGAEIVHTIDTDQKNTKQMAI